MADDEKYATDKVHEYEKAIQDLEKKKTEIQEQLDSIRESMATLLFEFSQTPQDPHKERAIHEKAEEEKQKQEEFNKTLKEQRKNVLQWRKRLASHYERGHGITKSIILPPIGTAGRSYINTDWDQKIIPFGDITIYSDKKLGEGAFGTVYKGMVYGNIVAIKRLKEPVDTANVNLEVSKSSASTNFKNECQLLGNLKNQNILRFMGASFLNEEEEQAKEGPKFLNCCILTEFADKGSLHDILHATSARDGNLRVRFTNVRKFTAIGQIVEGMSFLHNEGVVHLDLKPANILLDSEYNIRIADFGMSRVLSSFKTSIQTFVGGTPYYMAPEVLFADDPSMQMPKPSDKCDVYSFGILVNEFLTEDPPYSGMLGSKPTFDDLKRIVLKEGEMSRPTLYKEKHEEIIDLIKTCWNFNPEKRKSFKEILAEKVWEKAKQTLVNDSSSVGAKIQKQIEKVATKENKIKIDDFVRILREVHGLESELSKNNTNNQAAVDLFLEIPNRASTPEVDLSLVDRFLNWFSGYKSNEFVRAIQQVVKTKWFFGVMTKDQAEIELSKKENLHTGAFLVRWDQELGEFILSYIFTSKDKKDKKKGETKQIAHIQTKAKNLRELFETEKVWKLGQELNETRIPERPLGYRNLVGIWSGGSYVSSGTSYTLKIEGVSPSAPTQQETLNEQRGIPSFEMIL